MVEWECEFMFYFILKKELLAPQGHLKAHLFERKKRPSPSFALFENRFIATSRRFLGGWLGYDCNPAVHPMA